MPRGGFARTTRATMDGFEVRMYFIEILRKMNVLVIIVAQVTGYLALMKNYKS